MIFKREKLEEKIARLEYYNSKLKQENSDLLSTIRDNDLLAPGDNISGHFKDIDFIWSDQRDLTKQIEHAHSLGYAVSVTPVYNNKNIMVTPLRYVLSLKKVKHNA